MTLRVLKVSGTTVSSGTLRVLKVSGTAPKPSARLRILKVSGTTSYTSPTLRVLRVSGAVTQAAVLQDIASQSVASFNTVTITPTVATGGATPSAYRYTLLPNADVHTLPMTVASDTHNMTFVAPGRFNGCTVSIRVDAMNNAGSVIGTKTATVTVGRHADYMRVSGAWVAIKQPIRLTV